MTTALHIDQERELIHLARTASLDLSAALPAARIDRAAHTFLERNPAIDPAAGQWRAQRAMMTQLATGGRLGVAIGVAGAGKSTALAPLVDAWKADGRAVFGITLAWRQAADLKSAGIAERASVAAFLKRVEIGQYVLIAPALWLSTRSGCSAPGKCSISYGCKSERACKSSWSAIPSNASRSKPGRSLTCCARRLARRPFPRP